MAAVKGLGALVVFSVQLATELALVLGPWVLGPWDPAFGALSAWEGWHPPHQAGKRYIC